MSSIIVFHLVLLGLFIGETFSDLEIDQTIFFNPRKKFSFVRCPLEDVPSLNIQWFDSKQQQDDNNRGRYYRIEGTGENSRQLICSSGDRKVKLNIRIYGKLIRRISSLD